MADEVLTEKRGRVLLITLNRPEARNAINSAVGRALVEATRRLDDDAGLTAGSSPARARAFAPAWI